MLDTEINSPFVKFDPKTWASFKDASEKLYLTEDDLGKYLAFNDKLTLDEVKMMLLEELRPKRSILMEDEEEGEEDEIIKNN